MSDNMLARLTEIGEELDGFDPESMSADDETRFDELTEEATELRTKIETAERRAEAREELRTAVEERGSKALEGPASGVNRPNINTRTGSDPYDVSTIPFGASGSELRARAMDAIEQTIGDVDHDHRESATNVLRRVNDPSGVLAKRVLATGTPAYRSAFQKVAGGQSILLNQDERDALQRAQSLTGSGGGFAIPFTLDPTIIYTGDGAANPFRAISRVEQIVTDQWNGVSSTGVTGGFAAEASEVGDDAATLVQPSVDVERWDSFVPFSFEVGQDWSNLESDIRTLVQERRDEFELTAFTSGTGTNEPTGIITELDGGSSEIAPATAETFAIGDVYNLQRQLPPKYRSGGRATWLGEMGTYNAIRQFDTAGSSALWEYLGAGLPEQLLGYRAYENSDMDSSVDIDVGATADHFVLLFGDFRNYLIVDRVGMNMELVPHLFATANNRPSGQRGFLAWGRTGGGSLNDNAFVTLSIPTAA